MKFALVYTVALAAVSGYSSASPTTPDPTNDKAAVPPIRYQSPFRGYRPLGEDTLLPWKAANDEVARIGGWRAYAKEAREAPAAAAKPVTVPTAPAKPPVGSPVKPEPDHSQHGQPK